jgi:hypothetical protein
MPSSESITQWIHQLKEGERDAVQKLWESYFGSDATYLPP